MSPTHLQAPLLGTLLLLGCDTTDRERYVRALERRSDDPAAAAAACQAIGDAALAADCTWATVQVLAASAPEQAEARCLALPSWARDECFFVIADATGDGTWCAQAGALRRECALHRYRERMTVWLGRGDRPGSVEPRAELEMRAAGWTGAPEELWQATYQYLFMRCVDPSLRACDPVEDPAAHGACEAARHNARARQADLRRP